MSALRTPSRPAFDYQAPCATALRLTLAVAVSATALLGLAIGQDSSPAAAQVMHVTLPRVEIVAHRESVTPMASSVDATTTVASEGSAPRINPMSTAHGSLTQ